MSFIEMTGLDQVKEPEIAPEGDYRLVIGTAEVKPSKRTNRVGINTRLEFMDNPDYAPLYHGVWLPMEGDEEKTKEILMRNVRRFLEMFEIPFDANGFDASGWEGKQADDAHVVQEMVTDENDNETGDVRNSLVLKKLATEE